MIRQNRQGFTLIEFLVIVVFILILAALLFPAIQKLRQVAAIKSCQANMKQIGFALHDYHACFDHFPKGCASKEESLGGDRKLGWYVSLLPYLDQTGRLHFDGYSVYVETEQKELVPYDSIYLKCTLNPESKFLTHYIALAGIGKNAAERPTGSPLNGFMGYDRVTKLSEIKDGISNTICVVEVNKPKLFTHAESTLLSIEENQKYNFSDGEPFGGMHFDRSWIVTKSLIGINVLMCDGSVRNVSAKQIDNKLLVKLITIADSDNPTENFEW